MADNQRKCYLDILRIVSMLAVILMHTSSRCVSHLQPLDTQWQVNYVINGLTRWAVPVFVMISGALFLGRESIDIKLLFKKNILRLVTAYLFWSLLYTLTYSIIPYYGELSVISVKNAIAGTIKGGYYHLWFIPMIIGVYLLLPVIHLVTKYARRSLLRYFLILGVVIYFILPIVCRNDSMKNILADIVDSVGQSYVGLYVFYFILGYYLNNANHSKCCNGACIGLGIIGAAISVFVILQTARNNQYAAWISESNSVSVLLMSIGLFTWVKKRWVYLGNERMEHAIMLISRYTFGIYLVHELVLGSLYPRFFNWLAPFPRFLVLFVAVTVLSLLVVVVISKSKVLSKYII